MRAGEAPEGGVEGGGFQVRHHMDEWERMQGVGGGGVGKGGRGRGVGAKDQQEHEHDWIRSESIQHK